MRERLEALLAERILVLDGAYGTAIQARNLADDDYRGERFRDHPREVAGDPDLLNLTRPDVVEEIHRSYLAAGADIVTTNTFTATAIAQADYGLEEAVHDLNLAGARIARRAADAFGPDRFVAGSVGPDEPDALAVTPRERAGVPDGLVRPDGRGVRGADPWARRRRHRPAADRDDLRHAERQGGDRGGERRGARRAAHDLGHDHRPERPDALGADRGRVLALDHPRGTLQRRRELRARGGRDAPVPRIPRADRVRLHHLPPERRPAERVRRLRRAARDHLEVPPRVRRERPRERPRRVLRDHRRARPCDRRRRERPLAAQDPGRGHRHLVQRSGALLDHAGDGVRDDRRAAERHRLGSIPPVDRGRRLPGRGRDRSGPGPQRRQHARREHGRRPARRREGHDDVPQPDRDRARDRARPGDGRLLEVGRARGRPEVPPGQGHRELDQPEGGRGGIPREGAPRQALRGRGGRDGVRRAGTGRHGRTQAPDPRAFGRAADRPGRLRARGHRRRPLHPRDRDRDRGAQRVRHGVHRGHPSAQGAAARGQGLGRRLEPVLQLPRQRRRPRGDPLRVPVPRDRRGPRHGDRERRPDRALRGHPRRPPRARRGHHLRSAAGRDRAHGLLRRDRQGRRDEEGARPLMARDDRRGVA